MSNYGDVVDAVFENRRVGPEFGSRVHIDMTAGLRYISFIISLCQSRFNNLGFDFDNSTVVDIWLLQFGKRRWCPYPDKDEEEGDGQDDRPQKHLIGCDGS